MVLLDDWNDSDDDLCRDHVEPDYACVSCRAEIDHYLGCPDDPNPDYEAEAAYWAERQAADA